MSVTSDISKYFSLKRIAIPLLLGLAVTVFFLFGQSNDDTPGLTEIDWGLGGILWLGAGITLMVIRDFGYMWRLRILSDKALGWKQCFQIIMLWEFSSAVSPGAIGGTAAAVVIMAQEKLSTGRTTAIVLITSFLDEAYYMLMIPIAFWLIPGTSLFPAFEHVANNQIINTENLRGFFWSGYTFLLIWTFFLAFALFIRPKMARRLVRILSMLPLVRRWRRSGFKLADDMLEASLEFKQKDWKFWSKSFAATCLTWTARFLVINCIIMILNQVDAQEHWVIYGKQLVMWILLMIAITPGGSGIAELVFPAFMGPYIPSQKISKHMSVLWRLLTYYPYMVLGMMVFPVWAKRVELQQRLRSINLRQKPS